jgi:hypothetical protein
VSGQLTLSVAPKREMYIAYRRLVAYLRVALTYFIAQVEPMYMAPPGARAGEGEGDVCEDSLSSAI